MIYNKFVEYGRLVLCDHGALKGQLAVITDILNIKQIQIQGPNVPRQVIAVNHVYLTDFHKKSETAIESAAVNAIAKELIAEFEKSTAGKQIAAQKKRASLNDFERYTAQRLQQLRIKKVNELIGRK